MSSYVTTAQDMPSEKSIPCFPEGCDTIEFYDVWSGLSNYMVLKDIFFHVKDSYAEIPDGLPRVADWSDIQDAEQAVLDKFCTENGLKDHTFFMRHDLKALAALETAARANKSFRGRARPNPF